jgi:hypothetical protein
MDYDGYKLYELLKDGAETTLTHKGNTYKLRFRGEPVGSDNYLAVTNQHGKEKRFGRGPLGARVGHQADPALPPLQREG